jgi:hypothetical protein
VVIIEIGIEIEIEKIPDPDTDRETDRFLSGAGLKPIYISEQPVEGLIEAGTHEPSPAPAHGASPAARR